MEEHKKYLDEIIIKRRKQMEKRRYSSIQSGIYAGDELVIFAETELFGGSVKIFLPETFTDMPEEIRRVKYSCKNSPPVIRMNSSGETAFSFQMVEKHLDHSELEAALGQLRKILGKQQPSSVVLGKGIEKGMQESVAWMDYKGCGIDQALYQCLFTVPVRGQMMLGMFHCPFDKAEAWKTVVKEVIKTVCTEGA